MNELMNAKIALGLMEDSNENQAKYQRQSDYCRSQGRYSAQELAEMRERRGCFKSQMGL